MSAAENAKTIQKIQEYILKYFLGKDEIINLVLIALLSKGHILIEDVPGVGKTTLARAIAEAVDADFKRIQCTPDLLPSDIIGVSILNPQNQKFEFQKGPIFSDFLLVDEINRGSPRTQSALLEAMSEEQVSADRDTHKLSDVFFVLATQNSHEFEGTYPLPESQMDRFMMRITLGYPSGQEEKKIISTFKRNNHQKKTEPVINLDDLRKIQEEVTKIKIDESINEYILNIINATRDHEEIKIGASPRGGLLLNHGAKANAYIAGRDYVIPDDVKNLAIPILSHRIILAHKSSAHEKERVISEILGQIKVPL